MLWAAAVVPIVVNATARAAAHVVAEKVIEVFIKRSSGVGMIECTDDR